MVLTGIPLTHPATTYKFGPWLTTNLRKFFVNHERKLL